MSLSDGTRVLEVSKGRIENRGTDAEREKTTTLGRIEIEVEPDQYIVHATAKRTLIRVQATGFIGWHGIKAVDTSPGLRDPRDI
jgi:hypothetical protein